MKYFVVCRDEEEKKTFLIEEFANGDQALDRYRKVLDEYPNRKKYDVTYGMAKDRETFLKTHPRYRK